MTIHHRCYDNIICVLPLVTAFQVNRGIYIKLGQHIAQLDYLLPSPYVTTMKKMLRECPETAWPQVCRVFEKELGMHPEAAYKEIDKKPMASASLAQVHIAKDANGNKYAIKVQVSEFVPSTCL